MGVQPQVGTRERGAKLGALPCAWLLIASGLAAATPADTPGPLEAGVPLLQVFHPRDYDGHGQNWAILPTPDGRILVGNNEGVLEFDGERWRLIPVENRSAVRALALDPEDGRVWVGAQRDLGFLEADGTGHLRYVSLVDRLQEAERDFADVWHVGVTPGGVVFYTDTQLMRFTADAVETWRPQGEFFLGYQASGRYFVQELGRGLLELAGSALSEVPGTAALRDERIYAIVPWPEAGADALLVLTRNRGLFVLDQTGLSPWPTEAWHAIAPELSYAALPLSDGRLAIGTLQGGAFVLDRDGRWLARYTRREGLPDNGIKAMAEDREGGLWLATGAGLARLQEGRGLSRLDERHGLLGSVYAIARHRGALYAATANGLFRLVPGPQPSFAAVPEIVGQTWAMLDSAEGLLVGNYQGVYLLDGERIERIYRADSVLSLVMLPGPDERLLVGQLSGIAELRRQPEGWRFEGMLPAVTDQVRVLWPDTPDSVWVGTWNTGLIHLHAPDGDFRLERAEIRRYGTEHGLPDLRENWIVLPDGALRFATRAGIFRFDQAAGSFEPDPDFTHLFAGEPRAVSGLVSAPEGHWLNTRSAEAREQVVGLARRQDDGRLRWDEGPFKGLAGPSGGGPQRMLRDPDGVLWVGTDEGLLRFDPAPKSALRPPFRVLLRRVATGDGPALWGGSGTPRLAPLDYRDNRLRFEVAANSFDGRREYAFWLVGSDPAWSAWSPEPFKDYSNLREGRYRLQARARSIHGEEAEIAPLEFQVLPPWYRSLWAWFGYLLLATGAVWLAVRWRERRLHRQREALQRQVAEQTRQLVTLGELGRAITATLDLDDALETVYAQVNRMLPADVFAIGVVDRDAGVIDFRLVIQLGTRAAAYVRRLDDREQLAVRCAERLEPIRIGDYDKEYSRFITRRDDRLVTTPDGTPAGTLRSLLYVPAVLRQQAVGIVGVGSLRTHAFRRDHEDLLQTLASYAAIAIDNARAHAALRQSLEELEASRQQLIDAQQHLVRSEKLAALGQLVAGVAHEVNTPLGVALTANSHMRDAATTLAREVAAGTLSRSALDGFLRSVDEASGITDRNLRRAAELVSNFRQVSVDRSSEGRRSFELAGLLHELVQSLALLWKRRPISMDLQCDEGIVLDSFPGALGQVVTNLAQNALVHAFEPEQSGRIGLRARLSDDSTVEICFEDDGAGIPAEHLERIFEPFFTTRRGRGGSGLGLHILHNLVTQKLGGSVEVESRTGAGTRFRIRLPLHAPG
jgi:signal transduction histidine kinase/ligand-binding sensor domain-containing protein